MLRDFQKTIVFGLLCLSFILYSLHLYSTINATSFATTSQADQGKKLWQEKNCIACHQIYQLGGYLGPDLTNVYSLKGPDYIKVFLENGSLVMPKFNLSTIEQQAIVAYLKAIDATGTSDPRTFKITNNGMTEQ